MPTIRRKSWFKLHPKQRFRGQTDECRDLPHLDEKLKQMERELLKWEKRWDNAKRIDKKNEDSIKRIQTIRHQLITSRTMAELLERLVRGLNYNEVHHITIDLTEDFISTRSRTMASLPAEMHKHIRFNTRSELAALFPSHDPRNKILTYIGDKSGIIGPGLFEKEIKSCARVPMIHRDKLLGALNLGSRSAQRYSSDRSTDLLEDLAITAALCIDNVITHERNEELATTDPLTGTFNRRFFYDQAIQIMNLAKRHGDNLSCIYLDLNDFKLINDTYGHDIGDLALKRLVYSLKSRIRRTDILARLGGDEFALLLPRIAFTEGAFLKESLRQGIEEISFEAEGLAHLSLSAALGLASLQSDDNTLEDLINRADANMYKDKAGQKADQEFSEENTPAGPPV